MADAKDIQMTNYRKKPQLPIDRGWAWIIMIGVYVIMFVAVAFARSLSIFLPDILDRYNEPATVTTLAFGISDLSWSLTNIVMPGLLLPRFSIRTLVLTGAISHCFAVIALAYSPNIIVFNCLFGVVGAAGGLMLCPSMIHLGHYFKKRLSFASSVTHIGGSTSTVLVPGLAQFLKDTYGYQGALLIIGGLSFHCVAAAMLLWPLSMFDETDDTKELPDKSSNNDIQELLNINGAQAEFEIRSQEQEQEEDEVIHEAAKDEDINEESKFLSVKDHKNTQLNELNSTPDLKTAKWKYVTNGQLQLERNEEARPAKFIPLSETRFTRATSQHIHNELQKLSSHLPDLALDSQVNNQSDNCTQIGQPLSGDNDYIELDCSAAVRESRENYATCDPTDEHRTSMEEHVSNQAALIQGGSNSNQESTTPVTSGGCCSLQKIKAYFSSSVLLNPVAVMLVVAGGLSTPGGNMYLPVLGLENGLSTDEVSWMLTIIVPDTIVKQTHSQESGQGIADILGKLSIGIFADLGYVRPIRIACFAQLTVGMVCQFTTFYKGFGPMVGMAITFGVMSGVVHALMSPMVIELLGLPHLAQVTSAVFLSTGLFTFVLNVSVGAIKDATGSFLRGFNFLGAMMLTAFVILILEPMSVKCRDKFSKHVKN